LCVCLWVVWGVGGVCVVRVCGVCVVCLVCVVFVVCVCGVWCVCAVCVCVWCVCVCVVGVWCVCGVCVFFVCVWCVCVVWVCVVCVCVCRNNFYIATALAVRPRLVFDARAVHVVFVVDKVALSQVATPSTCGFPYQLLFHQCSTLFYPSSGRWTMDPLKEAVALRPKCRRTPREYGTTLNKYTQCNTVRAEPSHMVSPLTRRRLLFPALHMLSLLRPVNTFRCRTCYLQVLNLSAYHNLFLPN